MVLADNNVFLEELGRLYEQNRKTGCGSVWVTLKRTFPALNGVRGLKRKRALQDEEKLQTSVCLIRATNGKKKISTQVSLKEVTQFSSALMGVVRLNADDLRPSQRTHPTTNCPEAKSSDVIQSPGNKRMKTQRKCSAGEAGKQAVNAGSRAVGTEKREDSACEELGSENVRK
ncbi:signal recognition particle 14kd protein [Toxoplasma gondii TgCatPRC2]|uniref:Signal recognition particle 14 kDa protein n=4 Tax=Toxoplasma gondii TaxID=5811 RepID=S7UZB8_TOXGG|nr:signal recognition particle 14kd protein [Toxoplasma gondii GT1]KAF4641496.1 signal recognition particle 14kd protein [Toxoplasma gondii]KYK63442.1 signal recognition particle 14kd protein [Toxoplasma gondii TgCatPRC2]PIM03561.1 signal recognition particle 14kd protein [Toxoplasma gondii COUG]